jgi:hypothetical protein
MFLVETLVPNGGNAWTFNVKGSAGLRTMLNPEITSA